MEEQTVQSESAPHKLRWYQYRLRTLLLFVLVVAVILSMWRVYSQSQVGIAREIKSAWGDCAYEQYDIVGVNLSGADAYDDELLAKLPLLPNLKWVIVGGHGFTDKHLEKLKSLTSLKYLILDSTRTTLEKEKSLREALPNLTIVKTNWRAIAEFLLAKKRCQWHYIDDPDPNAYNGDFVSELKYLSSSKSTDLLCIPPNRKVPPNFDYSDDIGAHFGDYHFKPRIFRDVIHVDQRLFFEYSLDLPIREMSIEGKWFTDADVIDLIRIPDLSRLKLDGTSISSKGIERLKKAAQIVIAYNR